MLKNQLKVLLQRVYNGGRKPKKIIMCGALRDALRLEMQGSADYVQMTFPSEDLFYGVPVVMAPGVTQPLIEMVQEVENSKEIQIQDLL